MKKIQFFVLFLVSCALFLSAQSKIYWVDGTTGKVQRANTDGSSVQDLATGQGDTNAIAVDNVNGKIYWGKGTSPGFLKRANLDGTGVEVIWSASGNVCDIALDVVHGKVYWTDNTIGTIRRADLNGSNVQDLLTGRSDPNGISIDAANGKMYWVERTGPIIYRANLDGSSVQSLITSGLSSPYGLELDLKNSKIYFSDFGTGKIQRANLDGTGVTDILTGLGWDVDAIALDVDNGIIYYATYNTTISKVNFNGTGNAVVVSGLTLTTGVDFYSPTYTISGSAGVAGATLSYTDGSAKTATADGSGNYSFSVSNNWSGIVTPLKSGYTFVPASRTYANVSADQTSQNYTAQAITYTISGNAGIAGATLSYTDGTPKTATTDGSGNYSLTVSYSWSGTVTPSMTGYVFSPASRTYINVMANQASQDYSTAAITYTISGNAGIAGATLSYTDGTPKTATADGSGNYSFAVSFNWSGTVTPAYSGYGFTPASRTYTNVLANQTSQDYTATAITYTISGNAGIAGATLSYTDGTPKTATADGSGNYSFAVSYNWSGTVTPSMSGYTFAPVNRTYANVLANQTSQDYMATAITYTISGNAGMAGATLSYTDGSPKTATADGSGNYSFAVSYNWSGTVTPSLAGYAFTPSSRTYANVLANQNSQDYTAAAINYTISGNAGIAGATLSYTDGTPKTATADGSGNYSFTVSYNWSGTVTPSMSGYTFAPVNRTYANVLANQTSQDYTATAITYTISGNAGMAGATLSYTDGSPKTATANSSGNYTFSVSYNWSGTVTPSMSGYTFAPVNRTYANVLANQTSQDYMATAITYTISGNAGIAGATLSYTDGTPKTATADGSGNYSFTVSYNWSGTVTPSMSGYTFTPANRTYTNVLSNQTAQNYTAAAITYTISGNAGIAGATLGYSDGSAKTATTDGSGNYMFSVSYNWSGTVTPSMAGYTFTPVNRTYTNVLANQTSQDYTATAITYTISGNAGIAGATLSYTDGTPKTATADGSGNYSFAVSYDWSGTVTPSMSGYTFTPVNLTYVNVLANQTSQDYTATAITYTISGNAGIAGATLSYTDGTPKTATADGSGNYTFSVSYNWSGMVTPSLAGYAFTPASRNYANVLADQIGQNYSAVLITYSVDFVTDGTPGATLTGITSQVVAHGSSCTAVRANAPVDYHFGNWSGTGGFAATTSNPLTIANVTSSMTITAHFSRSPENGPPSIRITNPRDNDTVSGVVLIEAEALGDNPIAGVSFTIDGQMLSTSRDGRSAAAKPHGTLALGGLSLNVEDGLALALDRDHNLLLLTRHLQWRLLAGNEAGILDLQADDNGSLYIRRKENAGRLRWLKADLLTGQAEVMPEVFQGPRAMANSARMPAALRRLAATDGKGSIAIFNEGPMRVEWRCGGDEALAWPLPLTTIEKQRRAGSWLAIEGAGAGGKSLCLLNLSDGRSRSFEFSRSFPTLWGIMDDGSLLCASEARPGWPAEWGLYHCTTQGWFHEQGQALDSDLVRLELLSIPGMSGSSPQDEPEIDQRAKRENYSVIWDTRTLVSGFHVIKAAVTDSEGLAAQDRVEVLVQNIVLGLSIERRSEPLWIIRHDYADITVSLDNPNQIPVAKYVLERCEGGHWATLAEIAPSAFIGGKYQFQDDCLESGTDYIYRVRAVDGGGSVIASSPEVII